MSVIGAYSQMLFGVDGTQTARSSAGQNHQLIFENVSATTGRMIVGPRHTGHYSMHLFVAAGTSPVGTLTVWYSNLPNPDPQNDAHWVQDTTITGINLATVANTFLNIGNIQAEYVRFKATMTSGTASIILWARSEGVSV